MSNHKSNIYENEFNLILNVPDDIGQKLHQILSSENNITEEQLKEIGLEIIENPYNSNDIDENRKMIFKFENSLHPLTILDLPCHIEGCKTIDYKNFYKSSDICQMAFVHEETLDSEEKLENFTLKEAEKNKSFSKILWKKDFDHQYKVKHGISKAAKNVRKIRFKRKVLYDKEGVNETAKKRK